MTITRTALFGTAHAQSFQPAAKAVPDSYNNFVQQSTKRDANGNVSEVIYIDKTSDASYPSRFIVRHTMRNGEKSVALVHEYYIKEVDDVLGTTTYERQENVIISKTTGSLFKDMDDALTSIAGLIRNLHYWSGSAWVYTAGPAKMANFNAIADVYDDQPTTAWVDIT